MVGLAPGNCGFSLPVQEDIHPVHSGRFPIASLDGQRGTRQTCEGGPIKRRFDLYDWLTTSTSDGISGLGLPTLSYSLPSDLTWAVESPLVIYALQIRHEGPEGFDGTAKGEADPTSFSSAALGTYLFYLFNLTYLLSSA